MPRVRVAWIFVAVVVFCVFEEEVNASIPDPSEEDPGVVTQIDGENLDGRVEISTLDLLSTTTPEQEHSTTHRIRKYLKWHSRGLDSQKHNRSHSNLKTNNSSLNATRQGSSLKEVGGDEGLLTDASKSDAVRNLMNDRKASESIKEIADDKRENVDDSTTELQEQIIQSQATKLMKSHTRGSVRYIPQRLHLPSVSRSTTTSERIAETEITTAATVRNRFVTTRKFRKFLMRKKLGNEEFSPENVENESRTVSTLSSLNLKLGSVGSLEALSQNKEKKPMIEEAEVTKALLESEQNDEENLFQETGTEIDESLFESSDTTESDLFRIDQNNEDVSSITEKPFQQVTVLLPDSFTVEDVGKKIDLIESVISPTSIQPPNEKNEEEENPAVAREEKIILKSEVVVSSQLGENAASESRVNGRNITENDKLTISEQVPNVRSQSHSDAVFSKRADVENSRKHLEDNTVTSGFYHEDFTTIRSTNSDIDEHSTNTTQHKVPHIHKYLNRKSEHFTKTHLTESDTNDNFAHIKLVTSNPYKPQLSSTTSTHSDHNSTYNYKAGNISTIHLTENNVNENSFASTDANQSKQEDKMILKRKHINFKPKNFTALLHREKNITEYNDTLHKYQQVNKDLQFPTTNHTDVEISTEKWKLHRLPMMKPKNFTTTHSNFNWSSAKEATTKVGNKSIHMRNYLNMKPKNYYIKHLTDNGLTMNSTDTNFTATRINANRSNGSSEEDASTKIGSNRIHMHKYLNLRPQNATSIHLVQKHAIVGSSNEQIIRRDYNENSSVDSTTNKTEEKWTHKRKYFNLKLKNDSIVHLAKFSENNIVTQDSTLNNSNMNSSDTVLREKEQIRFHMRKYLNLKQRNSYNLTENHPLNRSTITTHFKTSIVNISSIGEAEHTTKDEIINHLTDSNSSDVSHTNTHVNGNGTSAGIVINNLENSVTHIPKYLNLKPENEHVIHTTENSTIANVTDGNIATASSISSSGVNSVGIDTTKTEHKRFHTRKYLNRQFKNTTDRLTENNPTYGNNTTHYSIKSIEGSSQSEDETTTEHKMIHMRKYLNMKPKNGTENKSSDANSDTVQLKENRSFEEAVTKERVANVSKHFNVKLENSSNGISPNTVVIKRFHMRKYLNLKPKNSSNHFEENHTADESINTTRIFTNISSESKTETTTEHHMFHTQKYVNMTYENITENNSTNGNAAKTNLEGNGDTVKKTNNTENYIINIPDVNLETDSSKHLTENTNESIVSPYIIPNSTNGSLSDVGLIKMEHENFHMRKYLTLKPKGSTNHLTENDIVINRTGGSASPHLSSTNESLADTSINQIEHQRIHMRPYLSLISETFPNHFIKKDVIMNTTDEYNSSPDFDITNGSYVGAGKNKTDQLKIHLEQDLDLKFENYSNHLSENNGITNNTGVYSSRHLIVTEANEGHADTNKTENHRTHMRKYLNLTPKISSNNLRENNAVMNITVAESRNLTEHQSLQIEKYHNLTNSTDISNHLIENNAIVNSTYGFSATPHLNISKTSKSDINEDTNKTKHTKFHTRTYLNLKPDNSSKHLKENSVMNSTDKIIIKSSKTEANSVKTNISGSSEKPKYLHLNHKNGTWIHHSHSKLFTNSLSQNGASEKLTTDDTPTTENSEITFTSSTVHPTVSSFKESSMNTNEATTIHNIMHIPKYFDIKPEHSLTITVTDRNEVTTEYNTEAPTTVVQTGGEISILLGKEIVDSAQINYSSSTTAQSHEMNEVKNEKILLNSTEVSLEHTKERSSNTLEDEEFQSSRILIEKIPSSGNFNLGNNIAVVGGISEVPFDENVQTSSFSSTEIDTAKDDETATIPQHKYNIIHQLLDASITTPISTTSTKTESNWLTSFENQNKTDLSSEYSTKKSELSLVSSESSDSVKDIERYRNENSLEQNISAEINTSSESPKHFPSPLVLSIQSATEEEIANTFLEHFDVIPTTPFAMTEIGLNPEVPIKTGESSVELSKETLITNNEDEISDAGQYNNEESTISIISTFSSVTTSEGDLAVIIPSEYHEISTKLPDKLTIIDNSYTSHLLNEENTVTSEASPSPEINTHLEYSTETLTMSLFSSSETPKRDETVYIKHKSEFTEISEGPDVNNSKISVENRKHIKQELEEKLPQVANTMTLDIESLLNASSNEYVNEANIITSETNPSSEINENFKYSTETPSFSSPDTLTRDKIIYINDSSIYPFSVISTSLPNEREIDNESEDIKVMITNNTISSSVETDNKSEPESVTENIITPAIIQIKKNNTETVKHLLKVGRFEETTETTEKDNFVSNYSQNIGDAITEELLSSYTDNTNGVTVALQKIVTLDSAHWYGVDVLSTTTQSVISNNDSEYDEILDNITEGEGSTIYAKDRKRELTTISEIFSTEQTELLISHDIELSQTLEQEKEFVTVDPAHWYGVESETEINNTKVPEAGEALVLRGRINMHQLINDSFASSETVDNQITSLTASKVENGFKEVTTEEKPAIDITTIPLSEATKTVEIVSNNTGGDDKRFGSSESVINQITFLTSSGTKVENGSNGDITIGANVVTDIPQYGVAGTEKEETVQNGLFHVENTSKKIFDNRFGTSETVENQITSLAPLSTNMDSDFIDDTIEGTSKIDVTSISHSPVNEPEEKKPTKSELHQVETISKKFTDSKDGHYPLDELTGIDLQEGGNKSDENESIISRVSQTVSLENNAGYIENTLSSSKNPTSATHNVTLTENTANLTTLSNIQGIATDSVTDRNESISKLVHSHEEKLATKFNDGINRNESLSALNKSNSENQGKVSESGKLEELNRDLTQTNYTSQFNEEVEKAKNTRTSSSTELNRASLIENTTEQRELSDGKLNRGSLITDESETVYVSTINDESAFTKTEELNHNISKSAVENRIQIKQEFEETTSHVANNTNESATTASSEKSNMINSTIKPISTNSDILESKVRTSSEVTLTKTTEDTVTEDELAIVSGEELTDDVTVVKVEFLEPIEFESVTRSTTKANKEETVYANVNEEVQQEYAVPYIKKKIFENDANFSVQVKIQNKTIYMPSDVAIIEDPKHLMLNFTWPSSENTFNYSLSLALNESTLGYLINKISLNFFKAGSTLKEAGKLQEDDLSVDSGGGILVTFSNTDFLRKQVEEENSSNLQKASEKRQDHIFYIEIILVVLIVVILIISVVSILLSKRRKPKTPEVEDKDVTTRL